VAFPLIFYLLTTTDHMLSWAMAILTAEALAKKAHALQAKLSKQRARMITSANKLRPLHSPSAGAGPAFSAGAKFGASLFGRPKTSLRAKSAEGKVVFHFRVTPVSRGSDFTNRLSGRAVQKTNAAHGDSASTSAGSHQSYIEREAAVELSSQSGHDKEAPEIDPGPEIGDAFASLLLTPGQAGYAAAAAAYIDRDGATETTASSFGNIADTLDQRIDFWRAVEMAEQKPAKHKITINPGIDAEFWDHVAADDSAPEYLKKIASSGRDVIISDQLREKEALIVYDYFLEHRTTTPKDAQTISFELGRGGRVQTRIVLELPADMTPIQRRQIAQEFCDKEFHQKEIRFHCAVHSPTKANDERNFHMHITFHDRPTSKMVDQSTGAMVWDFEIIEKKRDSSRHYIKTRPHQKDKNREFQEYKWLYKIRRDYADIVNAVRKQNGMLPIYDHRNYSEMGIAYEVLPNLTRSEFHDVQRGRDNPEAALKIDKRWDRALMKAADEAEMILPNKEVTKRFVNLIANVSKRAPASIVMAKAAHGAYIGTINRINDTRLDRVALKIAIDKELSALTPEIGPSSPDSKKMKAAIEQLHRHLAKPLDDQEELARESQRLAINQLILLEKQLGKISLGSLSLPGRSFSDLMGRAGLSGVLQIFQANQNTIEVPVAPPPATPSPPPIRTTVRPPTTPIPVTHPMQPIRPDAYTPPPLIDPGMGRLRQISQKAAAFAAPSKPPAQPDVIRNQASQPVSTAPTPSPVVTPKTIAPARASAPPPELQTKKVENPRPPVSAPAKLAGTVPAARTSPTAAPVTRPVSPASPTKTSDDQKRSSLAPTPVAGTMRPVVAPLSPQIPQKQGLSIADMKSSKTPAKPANPENSPSKPEPEKKPSNTAAPPNIILSKEEEERREKERRDRRRAILTNPPRPPRGRGGWER
jgi:hypothetical protein